MVVEMKKRDIRKSVLALTKEISSEIEGIFNDKEILEQEFEKTKAIDVTLPNKGIENGHKGFNKASGEFIAFKKNYELFSQAQSEVSKGFKDLPSCPDLFKLEECLTEIKKNVLKFRRHYRDFYLSTYMSLFTFLQYFSKHYNEFKEYSSDEVRLLRQYVTEMETKYTHAEPLSESYLKLLSQLLEVLSS